jgi:ubiquinone/menaquinone biosynthesis C-methylase UbiE
MEDLTAHYIKTKEFFDKIAEEKSGFYDAKNNKDLKHNVWQSRMRKFYRGFFDNLEKSDIKEVVDIGCGNGDFTLELAKKYPAINFTGADFSKKTIYIAKENSGGISNSSFFASDILSIPDENQFDVSVCINTLCHILNEDLEKVLDKIAKITKKHIILEIKNEKNFYYGFIRKYRHPRINIYPTSVERVSEILKSRGFFPKEIKPIFYFQFLSPLIVIRFSKNK